MSNLVLELKPGETMLINGAGLRFRTRTRIELTSRARFLFGKQIMTGDEAVTPWRRLYHALQIAYVGSDCERPEALAALAELMREAEAATVPGEEAAELIAAFHAAMDADEAYAALKLVRRLIAIEDARARSPHVDLS